MYLVYLSVRFTTLRTRDDREIEIRIGSKRTPRYTRYTLGTSVTEFSELVQGKRVGVA